MALAACSACSSGSGSGVSPGGSAGAAGAGGAPTTCGGLAAPSAACAACERGACCDAATACAADKACAAFEACDAACAGDDTCRLGCITDNGGKVPERWPALATCRAASCSEACGATCGGLLLPDATCGACMRTSCCDQVAACTKDLACTQLVSCLIGCGFDGACSTACRVPYQAGQGKLDDLTNCSAGGDCASKCAEEDLSCVGNVQWAGAPGGVYGLQVTYTDAQSNKPAPGVHLLACSRAAVECTQATAIGEAYTDANGVAGIVINGNEVSWTRVDGPGDFLPALVFYRPPIVETQFLHTWFYTLSAAIKQMAPAAVIDPAKAQLHVFAQDCARRPLQGATVEVTALGMQLPVVYSRADYTPDPALVETGPTGEARSLNIPVTDADGFPIADITVKRGGVKIAHTSVRLHAGYWSELTGLPPTPAAE